MSEIRDFHNKYEGKPLFIVGNGKSLQVTPLEKMEYTMAMNNIALIYDEREWRPTFYWNSTKNIEGLWWYEQACKTINLGIPSFVRQHSSLPRLTNVIRFDYIYAFDDGIPHALWARDAAKCMFHYRMSVYGATQMACYMGFNPIYLVGCDLNFSKDPDECHFDNRYEGEFEWTDEKVDWENYWQEVAHKRIKGFTDQMGFEVYNATVGGNLEVYPRVNVKDVI